MKKVLSALQALVLVLGVIALLLVIAKVAGAQGPGASVIFQANAPSGQCPQGSVAHAYNPLQLWLCDNTGNWTQKVQPYYIGTATIGGQLLTLAGCETPATATIAGAVPGDAIWTNFADGTSILSVNVNLQLNGSVTSLNTVTVNECATIALGITPTSKTVNIVGFHHT